MNRIIINNHGEVSTITASNQAVIISAHASAGVYGSLNNGAVSLQQGYTTVTPESVVQKNLDRLIEDADTNGGFYVSRINGVSGTPDMTDTFPKKSGGCFSIVGGNTTDIAPFVPSNVSNIFSDNGYAGLTIDDFGRPDVDCEDYATIYKLSSRLNDYLDNVKKQIIGNPLENGSVAKVYGVHKQYQAAIRLWNNIVQLSSIRANVTYQNKHVFVQISITNNTDAAIDDFIVPINVRFEQRPGYKTNNNLYFTFEKADAYVNNSSNKSLISYWDDENGTLNCSSLPAGNTITLSMQYKVSTTESTETTRVVYKMSAIREARVRVIPGLKTTPPATHSNFEVYYDYPEMGGLSAISTGYIKVSAPGGYTEADKGNYIVTILNTGVNPKVSISGPSKSTITPDNITCIGRFIEGDMFSFDIHPEVEVVEIPLIQKETIDATITLNNIPATGDIINKVTKKLNVYLTDEESTVGVLSATVIPDIKVVGMDVAGGDLLQGSVSIGSVSIGTVKLGTVSIGSVSIGTVSIGTVKLGRVSIGTVSIGTVSVGTVSVGTVRIGTVSVGTVSVGTVKLGTVSVGTVSIGTVRVGTVRLGTVSIGTVSIGTVKLGTVSIGTVSIGTVSLGTVSIGTVSIGTVSIGTVKLGTVSIGTVSVGSVTTGSVIVGKIIVRTTTVKYKVIEPTVSYTPVTLDADVTYSTTS